MADLNLFRLGYDKGDFVHKVTHGRIDLWEEGTARPILDNFGIPERVYHSFFLGRILQSPNAKFLDSAATSQMRPGQFVLDHQFGGDACSHARLWGIFVPLSTHPDREYALKVRNTIVAHSECSSTDEYLLLKNALRRLLPLELMPLSGGIDGTTEAMLRFADSVAALDWLKTSRCRFVSEFIGKSADEIVGGLEIATGSEQTHDVLVSGEAIKAAIKSRVISRTSEIPWADAKEFATWLSCDGRFDVPPSSVTAAYIYENSD